MITQEQFAEWKEHPVTKEVMLEVQKSINDLTERIIDGRTIGTSAEVTHGLTNKIVGQIDGLNQLLNITFADEKIFDDVSHLSGY